MKRQIIQIDETKCNGCGNCIPNCHEGALQIIDGKAILISDLMCDGLGACIGFCPEDALEIIERDAELYDETKVMEGMIAKGKNVVTAHLKHLKEHGEFKYLKEGIIYLNQHKNQVSFDITSVIDEIHHVTPGIKNTKSHEATETKILKTEGCPGSQSKTFTLINSSPLNSKEMPSALTQWPVQMHLINPSASYFWEADILIAADCVAFSVGNFHSKYLSGKKLAIGCPKLDSNKESYLDKTIRLIDEAKVNTITVIIMEVPCCGGLLQMVHNAVKASKRKVPVKAITISIQGESLSEEWV